MSEERPPYDTESLKELHSADQRSQADKEHDRAIMKCTAFTAGHYKFLKSQGLPDELVERLTETFHHAYLQSALPQPQMAINTWTTMTVDDDNGNIMPGDTGLFPPPGGR